MKGKIMITGTITSKGQITVPKKIREFLQLKQSDEVVFIPLEDGKVLMTNKRLPPEALFGLLKHRKQSKAVSISKMEEAIRQRRVLRNLQ
jgi:AbrB family looped-hinge helix DNA binding protein